MASGNPAAASGEMSLLGQMLLGLASRTDETSQSPQPKTSKRPKGKIIRGESREIISNVTKYFEEEAALHGLKYPVQQVLKRTAAATGVSHGTISRISKELAQATTTGAFVTPGKCRPHATRVILDDFDKCVLRRTIHDSYVLYKTVPSLNTLQKKLQQELLNYSGSRSSLHKMVLGIGFRWRHCENKKKALVERTDIVIKRCEYLRALRRFREEHRPIVWIDEKWISTNVTVGKCWQNPEEIGPFSPNRSGERIIVIRAGGESGFIKNAEIAFKVKSKKGDYHGEMSKDLFMKWVQEKLIPNLPANSVIILDNAPYHNMELDKPPNSKTAKRDIQDWLTSRGISFAEDLRTPELLGLIKQNKPQAMYQVDEIAIASGHTVLRLPPYHCDLNPIEYAWNEVKHYVKSKNEDGNIEDILRLSAEGFKVVAENHWQNYCGQVKKLEVEYWEKDDLIDDTQQLIVNFESSDDESGSDDSGSYVDDS